MKRLIVSTKLGTNIYNSVRKLKIVDHKGHKVKRVEKREAFTCSEVGEYNFIKYETLKYSQKRV